MDGEIARALAVAQSWGGWGVTGKGHHVEADLHAGSESEDGTDLVVEVKDWERPLTRDAAAAFVETRNRLVGRLERRTVFLVYSEGGVSPDAGAVLAGAGVLVLDVDKLVGYEMPSSDLLR